MAGEMLKAVVARDLKRLGELIAERRSYVWETGGSRKETPLHMAAREGMIDFVKMLLAAKANPNARDFGDHTPLHEAASRGHDETVGLLIAAKADVNAVSRQGITPLMSAAAAEGDYDAVTRTAGLLLEGGADPNAKTEVGETALHRAAKNGHAGVVGLLIGAKAEVDAAMRVDGTALMCAADSFWDDETVAEIVKLLLGAGADARVATIGGTTALLDAARRGLMETARLLIAAGVDFDVVSNSWGTPLMAAARLNDESEEALAMVGLLLDSGAPVDTEDKTGKSALLVALRNGNARTAQFLLVAGAVADGRRALDEASECYSADAGRVKAVIAVAEGIMAKQHPGYAASRDAESERFRRIAADYASSDVRRDMLKKLETGNWTACRKLCLGEAVEVLAGLGLKMAAPTREEKNDDVWDELFPDRRLLYAVLDGAPPAARGGLAADMFSSIPFFMASPMEIAILSGNRKALGKMLTRFNDPAKRRRRDRAKEKDIVMGGWTGLTHRARTSGIHLLNAGHDVFRCAMVLAVLTDRDMAQDMLRAGFNPSKGIGGLAKLGANIQKWLGEDAENLAKLGFVPKIPPEEAAKWLGEQNGMQSALYDTLKKPRSPERDRMVSELIAGGAPVGVASLRAAAQADEADVLDLLLRHGGNPLAMDSYGDVAPDRDHSDRILAVWHAHGANLKDAGIPKDRLENLPAAVAFNQAESLDDFLPPAAGGKGSGPGGGL